MSIMWKQSGFPLFETHLSRNLNAAERVLPAAHLREKHPLFICRRGTACVFPPTYQNTSASSASRKSPPQVLHTVQLLPVLSSLPASTGQVICPHSKSLLCHQAILSTPSLAHMALETTHGSSLFTAAASQSNHWGPRVHCESGG